MPKIIVCYLRAGSDVLEDHFLNRLAARAAPVFDQHDMQDPVVHVELFFPNKIDENTGVSAGIHYAGRAFMHPKRFSRKSWSFHSVPVTQTQFNRAKSFCQVQRGANFNYMGFFGPRMCNISHSRRVREMGTKKLKWFCSELVSYSLYNADVLDDEMAQAAAQHPHAAHHVIASTCATFIDSARNISKKRLEL